MSNEMTRDQMLALLAQMKEENAQLKAKVITKQALSMKVSDKGALSIYGLGRFPVTLYRGQWERLFAAKDQIEAFIGANASGLTVKA